MKDYYQILEVDRSASQIKIQKSYRRLAMKWHPDINSSAEAHNTFVEINEAYQVLRNADKRRRYHSLYDYHLQKAEKPQPKRYKQWQRKQQANATKGKERGEKHARKSSRQYKIDWCFTLIEMFGELIVDLFVRLFFGILEIVN